MGTRPTSSELAILEHYRVAMTNVESHPVIAEAMAAHGYDSETLNTGKQLLNDTWVVYDSSHKVKSNKAVAYRNFKVKRDKLEEMYCMHRKKAKVVFNNDFESADKLDLNAAYTKSYFKRMNTIKRFYTVTSADEGLKSELARLKLTQLEIEDGLAKIADVEAARAAYLIVKGDSQSATEEKKASFKVIRDWMQEFFRVAKIALNDKPQLLESLGKVVKS